MKEPAKSSVELKKPKTGLARLFGALGPGVVTGAADDDPSGIATYSITGAQLGTSLLWTSLLTWPLMAVAQNMCARIGMVTGLGLADTLRSKFPKWVLAIVSVALFAANTVNVGADLSGMADSASMLTGINGKVFVVLFGVAIALATLFFSYKHVANILKWLTLSLFTYVVSAFIIHVDWKTVAHDSFVPSIPEGSAGWSTLVAILGTTISPYLFFWQTAEEVEERKEKGRKSPSRQLGASPRDLADRRLDVSVGTFFSNLIMFFVILTTAMTLHQRGVTHIETTKQAAEALRPVAGRFASTLFTLGILGVGFLTIPTLTGSAAYALAETFGWKQGLNESVGKARPFYAVIALSTVIGVGLDFLHISPLRALFLTSIINGLLAPILLVGIVIVASDKRLMIDQPSSLISRVVVGATALLMAGAAVGMFVFM